MASEAITISAVITDPTDPVTQPANPPVVEAGGCTYNPMARSFDMIFLLMSALGLFYFSKRRRNAVMDA